MATYEEMFGSSEDAPGDARSTGAFRFPAPVRADPAALPPRPKATAPLMHSVLGSRKSSRPLREVTPRPIAPGSFQADLIAQAAHELRTIRIAGKTRAPYDPEKPEPFWEACSDTAKAAMEAEAAIKDPHEAAIACAIFKAAGFYAGGINLMTLQAQVQAQMFVIERARQLSVLFLEQQELPAVARVPASQA